MPDIDWLNLTAPSLYMQDTFLNMFMSFGLFQMVLEATRGDNTLDLFFSNEPNLLSDITINPSISDHDTVSCTLNLSFCQKNYT